MVSLPDGGRSAVDYNPGAGGRITTTTALDSRSTTRAELHDGVGRVVSQQDLSIPNSIVIVDTTYDSRGLRASQSNPYLSSGNNGSGSTTYGLSTMTYDALGRLTNIAQPDHTSRKRVYRGNTATLIDENGSAWTQTSDALGRLTQLAEPLGATTIYVYDFLDNLTGVTQNGMSPEIPRSRTFHYDSLSRLITSYNPESGTVCYGTWSGGSTNQGSCQNGYDLNGNLQAKTDARSTTLFSYDSLNRMTGKVFSDGTPSACFMFDVAPGGGAIANGTGRLTAEWTQAGTCSSQGNTPSASFTWVKIGQYDGMGRKMTETQCQFAPCSSSGPGMVANVLQYTYDLSGAVTSSTNGMTGALSPGIQFNYQRDEAGRPQSVLSSWDSAATYPATLFKADSSIGTTPYGPFGLIAAQFGIPSGSQQAALSQTRHYDTRGRVTLDQYASGGGSGSTPPPSGGSDGTLKLSMNTDPVASGVTAVATTSCSRCGTGSGGWNIDNNLSGGFTYDPQAVIQLEVRPDLAAAPHTLEVFFQNDADQTITRKSMSFTVNTAQLPIPTLNVSVSPQQVPYTESGTITVRNSCAVACGKARYFVDGIFAGGLEFDEHGVAVGMTSTAFGEGSHTLQVDYFGNANFAQASKSTSFDIVPLTLPTPSIDVSVDPASIPEGEYGTVHIHNSCGSACGSGQYFIDGQFAGGFYLDDSGDDFPPIYPGWGQGDHTLTVSYTGNEQFAPAPGSTVFHVIANNLPVPTLSITPPQVPLPANTYVLATVQMVGCTTGCGGAGDLFVDDQYSGSFFLDSNGTGTAYIRSEPAGTHVVRAEYHGNLAWKQTSFSQTFTFTAQ